MRGATFLCNVKDAIVIDIGGTTTDVGVVLDTGFPRQASTRVKVYLQANILGYRQFRCLSRDPLFKPTPVFNAKKVDFRYYPLYKPTLLLEV